MTDTRNVAASRVTGSFNPSANKPGSTGPVSQHTPVADMAKRTPQPGTDALRRATGRK